MPPAWEQRRGMDVRRCFQTERPTVVAKPVGGFHPIEVRQLLAAWSFYRTGFFRRFLDFRVYLALHEVHERRLTAKRIAARRRRRPQKNGPDRDALERELLTLVNGISVRLVKEPK